jgi:hypothetical protein
LLVRRSTSSERPVPLRSVHNRNGRRDHGEPLVLASRMSHLIDLAPDVLATVTSLDPGALAHLALWLADVSAEAALIALNDPASPDPNGQSVPE